MSTKRVLVGEIATAHGIKGLVKIRSYVDDENLLQNGPLYTAESGEQTIKLKLKNAIKSDWLAEVDGVPDRNAAEELRGTQLYIDRDQLPDADDGEYYIDDLIGLKVIDSNKNEIGAIIAVDNFGASDLLDIKPAQGGASFYLPYTDETVIEIDIEGGTIIVEIPEGLLE